MTPRTKAVAKTTQPPKRFIATSADSQLRFEFRVSIDVAEDEISCAPETLAQQALEHIEGLCERELDTRPIRVEVEVTKYAEKIT